MNWSLVIGFALIGGCGGAQTEPATPDPQTPETAAPTAGGPAEGGMSWADMNEKQKADYMKKVALPKMKAVFQEHDAQEFAGMDCKVCHGSGAEKGDFHMPNPELPQLNPANQFAEHMEHEPEMMKFMATRVVPEMANLLGMQPYDPGTNKGFGCFGCHTQGEGGSHDHHDHDKKDEHEH